MKRLLASLIALLLFIGLSGCSSNPSDDDIIKSGNAPFESIDNLVGKLGRNFKLSDYICIDYVDVVDSYKKNNIYYLQVIPHIEIKKDFDENTLINAKIEPSSVVGGSIMDTMSFMKGLQLYDDGKIKKYEINKRRNNLKFEEGNDFDGLKSTYKFRKTDNGWMALD